MNIINVDLKFSNPLQLRKKTNYIIVHHTACSIASVQDIHKWHKIDNGWSGIGYHVYVRKDGLIYAGRPFGTIGAHCLGKNEESVGVCFEGNFEIEKMTLSQIEKGAELLQYIKKIYPEASFAKHKDFYKTSCPGRYFEDKIFNETTKKEKPETVDFDINLALEYLKKSKQFTFENFIEALYEFQQNKNKKS